MTASTPTGEAEGRELLPCPFCGGEAEMDTSQGYRNFSSGDIQTGIAVYCVACGVQAMICRGDVRDVEPEDVMTIWNRRAPPIPIGGGKPTLRVIDPSQWEPCSPAWLAEHPNDCGAAPRVYCDAEANHYHPKGWAAEPTLRGAVREAAVKLGAWKDEHHDCDCRAGTSCGCDELRQIIQALDVEAMTDADLIPIALPSPATGGPQPNEQDSRALKLAARRLLEFGQDLGCPPGIDPLGFAKNKLALASQATGGVETGKLLDASDLANKATVDHPDAYLNALLNYTRDLFGTLIAGGWKAAQIVDCFQHIERAARGLHAKALASQPPAVGPTKEEAARAVDPDAWSDDGPIPTRADTINFYARRQASIEIACRVLALFNGAGGWSSEELALRMTLDHIAHDYEAPFDASDAASMHSLAASHFEGK